MVNIRKRIFFLFLIYSLFLYLRDPEDYGKWNRMISLNRKDFLFLDNLVDIRLPIKRIWQPDVTLYN